MLLEMLKQAAKDNLFYLRNARLGSLRHGWIGALATATISEEHGV
jgi:hypothetical protein